LIGFYNTYTPRDADDQFQQYFELTISESRATTQHIPVNYEDKQTLSK